VLLLELIHGELCRITLPAGQEFPGCISPVGTVATIHPFGLGLFWTKNVSSEGKSLSGNGERHQTREETVEQHAREV